MPGDREHAELIENSSSRSSSWNGRDWRNLLFLFVLSACAILPGLTHFGIIDPSDGLYPECSREMIERHDWMTPSFNYQPFYEKPILIYWCIIASFKLLGISDWSGRVPSALSAVLCVGGMYALVRGLVSRRAAMISSVVLLCCPLFAVVAHLALTDMLLTLFMTCAVLCLFRRWHGAGPAMLVAAYALLGLAVLVKGPVALLLVGAIMVSYLVIRGKDSEEPWYRYWWRAIWPLHPIAGLCLIALISLPWYLAECRVTNGEFFQEFFIRQNLGRVAGSVNHQNPWYYYIPFLVGGLLPWWLPFLGCSTFLKHIWTRRKRPTGRQQLLLLSACWLLVVVALFSAVKTKLGTYILPAFPPFAIICGVLVDTLIRKRAWAPLAVPAGAISAVGIIALIGLPFVAAKSHQFSCGTEACFALGLIALAAGFATCFACLRKGDGNRAVLAGGVGATIGVALLVGAGLHQYDKLQHLPFRQLVKESQLHSGNLALFLRDTPAGNFYTRKAIPMLATREDFEKFAASGSGTHYVMVTKDVLQKARERAPNLVQLDHRGKWYLFVID